MSKLKPASMHTTATVRRAIQQSQESIRSLARRYGINPKTVAKWRQRASVADLKTGPKDSRSSVLTLDEEALIATFRQHVVLPLDDCLIALQTVIPNLTRSSLHRCLQRYGISRQPKLHPDASIRPYLDGSLFGNFSVGVVAAHKGTHKYQLFVAVELASKFVFAEWYETAKENPAVDFLGALINSAPCKIRTIIMQSDMLPGIQTLKDICAAHDIELRPNEQIYCWSDDQFQRIDTVIKKAIDKQPGDAIAFSLGSKLVDLATNYNLNCKLNALGGIAPRAYLGKLKEGVVAANDNQPTQSWDRESKHVNGSARAAAARKKPRSRNPESTREAILQAARTCLAHDGPEGLSLAEVARIAGVNRGTAYQHFKTRENLIAASAEWVSEKLFRAVFGEPQQVAGQPVGQVDVAELIDRLANFAMDNPELCRAWLLQVLSSPNPSNDQFWKQYAGSTERFAATKLAKDNVDSEVLSVIMLAGAFLWPVWARTHSRGKENLRPLAHRFAHECLRISMYGNLRSEHYPAVAERLATYQRNAGG